MNLGKGIKRALELKKMTQKELSIKTDISQTSISMFCKGRSVPAKKTLEILAGGIGVPLQLIILFSCEKSDFPESRWKMYDIVWVALEDIFIKLFVNEI